MLFSCQLQPNPPFEYHIYGMTSNLFGGYPILASNRENI